MLVHDRIEQLATPEQVKNAGFMRNPVYARVRIYEHDGKRIALVTELDNNPGQSVTNAAEIVYETVTARHRPDLLLEHYPDDNEYDLVCTAGEVSWKRCTTQEFIEIIGERPKPHTSTDEPAWLQLAGTPHPPTAEERRDAELAEIEERIHDRAIQELAASFRSTEKEYRGIFDDRGRPQIVVVDQNGGRLLRHHVRHSPMGLFWGYSGSGPAEAARCILADALGLEPLGDKTPPPFPFNTTSIPEIDRIYQAFKDNVIARLPKDKEWTLPLTRVQAFLEDHPPRRVCPIHREPEDHLHECESCTEERIAEAEGQD